MTCYNYSGMTFIRGGKHDPSASGSKAPDWQEARMLRLQLHSRIEGQAGKGGETGIALDRTFRCQEHSYAGH